MSKKLSLESLTKKLRNVANTQDSIPMFSLWIIHHKAHYELIVDTWMEIIKESKPKHRLTLLYLANDVIQSCRRKKADVFKDYFATVLPEAIALLRDKTISPGVERVLNVWSSRKIYDIDFIDQLHAALLTNRTPDALRQKLLAEYKPSTLIEKIEDFKKCEDLISSDEKQIRSLNVDASSSDNIHKLKDKAGGEVYSKNFEESATNIERFIVQYENLVEKRKQLIEELNQAAVFYRAQYHEAKVVVDAYQSFDVRVSKMKKMLDQVKSKFMPKTPEREELRDSTMADMDMSDSDQELGSKPSNIVAVDTSVNRKQAVKSTINLGTKPSPSSSISRPGMRGASTSSLFSSSQNVSGNLTIPTISNGTVTPTVSSKVSTPSGSPPSPEGSPDLNISSPPRYPSLESRLADIFSIDSKPGLSSATENTGSDTDGDSEANPPPLKKDEKSLESSVEKFDTIKPVQNSQPVRSESWQNTIPVIGGNRRTSTQSSNYMDNIGMSQDGGSTPLQDEGQPENETYAQRRISRSDSVPPPSFSGDALTFLTKFMGQQTSTALSQQPAQSNSTVSTAISVARPDVLQNLNIDQSIWSSLQNITQNITASAAKWSESSSYPQTTSMHNGNTISTLSTDTDYRTANAGDSSISTASLINSANDYSHRRLSESASKPPLEDYVVEEEELLVDPDPPLSSHVEEFGGNPIHFENLKDIPAMHSELSPPPRPPSVGNFIPMPGQIRHFPNEEDPLGDRHFPDSDMRIELAHPRFPPRPRMPNQGSLRRPPHGMPFRRGREPLPLSRRARLSVESAFAEEQYYDRLYDELCPKFPRLPGRGRFPPRRSFR